MDNKYNIPRWNLNWWESNKKFIRNLSYNNFIELILITLRYTQNFIYVAHIFGRFEQLLEANVSLTSIVTNQRNNINI